ncbi:hypothetical protein [Phytohabitans houttuyneae]|uniref:Uncharacterized protein n=1 Tax=Phytohabitans houttuyneae TaxID=1076126 RepID=A0A6V8KCL7_9ACTN|nr:hypothetical protein [Phytohabitans houttuyneae]GFJ79457.1 hypothetical protein Phou_036370 [Phytohabitans houttuyneae]
MARKDMVLVYIADPRWYITEEVDDPQRPRRRWWRLWWNSIDHGYTGRRDGDQLRELLERARLDPDPGAWRQPTAEEKRPRRDG